MTRSLLVVVVALFLTVGLFGQTRNAVRPVETTMILTGTVYDINGSVVTTGRVFAESLGSQRKYEARTSSEGAYTIELPLDIYKVEAAAPGFCPTRLDRFRVVNSTLGKMSLDMVLEVGGNHLGCRREITIKKKLPRKGHGRLRT